jgi:FixJ family two-component response regulator
MPRRSRAGLYLPQTLGGALQRLVLLRETEAGAVNAAWRFLCFRTWRSASPFAIAAARVDALDWRLLPAISRSQAVYSRQSISEVNDPVSRPCLVNEQQPLPDRVKERSRTPLTDISVLVVDDDLGTRDTFEWKLRSSGMHVRTSASGADAIRLAKAESFDLLVIDLELQDMRGTDVIRAVRTGATDTSFVLISAFLTTDITVEAMRLGASDVLDKPVSVDELADLVRAATAARRNAHQSPDPRAGLISLANLRRFVESVRSGSSAERWALNVIKGCFAEQDPKTLQRWADNIPVSYTTLCESCRLIGIDPRDARDLMRMLRAVLHSSTYGCSLDVLLDTNDSRTLARLIDRAGFQSAVDVQSVSIEGFLSRQRFVQSDSHAVLLVRNLLLRFTR